MKGFPNYYKLFGIRLFPKGWEDLGVVEKQYTAPGEYSVPAHGFCVSGLHVGRDADNKLFRFCKRCLVRM